MQHQAPNLAGHLLIAPLFGFGGIADDAVGLGKPLLFFVFVTVGIAGLPSGVLRR